MMTGDLSPDFSRQRHRTRAEGGLDRAALRAQTPQPLLLVNGKIHTMDATGRVVSQAVIENGRFAAVGNSLSARGARRLDLKGRTAIPGLIDAHNHIVLVGNRPGWHTPLEHVFTIPEAIALLKTRSADVPRGEFVTPVGPVSAGSLRAPARADGTRRDRSSRLHSGGAQGARARTRGKAAEAKA
jgi:predicted amidohydrolase YtcJ